MLTNIYGFLWLVLKDLRVKYLHFFPCLITAVNHKLLERHFKNRKLHTFMLQKLSIASWVMSYELSWASWLSKMTWNREKCCAISLGSCAELSGIEWMIKYIYASYRVLTFTSAQTMHINPPRQTNMGTEHNNHMGKFKLNISYQPLFSVFILND